MRAKAGILRIILVLLLIAGAMFTLAACGNSGTDQTEDTTAAAVEQTEESISVPPEETDISESQSSATAEQAAQSIDEYGEYTTKDDVAAYIHTYHKLPPNYVLDDEARAMGWSRQECPADYGIMIGGRSFGNRERLLPKGRYYECDVDYDGKARGVKRLVYTKDGTVYYTADHYNSFTQLY